MYTIYVTSIHESQISLRFALDLRPAVFEIIPIWDKCTKWPQNDLEQEKVKCTPYICYYNPQVPNFSPFHSTTNHFSNTDHFEANGDQMYPICVTSIPKSQNHPVSLYDQPFLRYRPFWQKCKQMTQNDLQPEKVKSTIYVLLASNLPCFTVLSAVFEIRPFWDKCTERHQTDVEPYKIKCTLYMCY